MRLTVHTGPAGWQADGSGVAFIDFEVVDAQGNRCPTDEARVHFAMQGPAIWRCGSNPTSPRHAKTSGTPDSCWTNCPTPQH